MFSQCASWFRSHVDDWDSFGPRLRQATFQGLGDLPGGSVESFSRTVSADGQTIVGWGIGPAGNNEAWSASLMVPCPIVSSRMPLITIKPFLDLFPLFHPGIIIILINLL